MACYPVDPTTLFNGAYQADDAKSVLDRSIAVRCDFKPVSTLTKPIAALFSVITGAVFTTNDFGIISYALRFDKQDNCFWDQSMAGPYCMDTTTP